MGKKIAGSTCVGSSLTRLAGLLYAFLWIASQEAKAVGPDPLNENSRCDTEPHQAHWDGEDGDQRQHPREQSASVVEPVVLDDEEAREQNTPEDENRTAARVEGVEVDFILG